MRNNELGKTGRIWLLSACWLLLPMMLQAQDQGNSLPNIVLIFADDVGQPRAEAEPAHLLKNGAGDQSYGKNRHRNRCHTDKEFDEFPTGDFCDEEVLRFANQGANAAQCGANCAVHH